VRADQTSFVKPHTVLVPEHIDADTQRIEFGELLMSAVVHCIDRASSCTLLLIDARRKAVQPEWFEPPCWPHAGGARAAARDAAGAGDVRRRAVRLAPQPRAGARCPSAVSQGTPVTVAVCR
jgi:hypothetical protein